MILLLKLPSFLEDVVLLDKELAAALHHHEVELSVGLRNLIW